MPSRREQILAVHGGFARSVVEAAQTPGGEQDLELLLSAAEENGWHALVSAVRRIVGGDRSVSMLEGLDEEDRVIAEAILNGLQNPSSLPIPDVQPDPALAAPGLAAMIQAARTGDVQALTLVSEMAEHMSKAGGDLARIAGIIRPLVNGERNVEKLCKGMSAQGERLVLNILSELGGLGVH
jgi:hypothetical protein